MNKTQCQAARRSIEIDVVMDWYEREGRLSHYWVPNPLSQGELQPTKQRKKLYQGVNRLIGYLESDDMVMAYCEANDLKINLKQLVTNALGAGIVAHIARTRVHR